ncbi:hypothetical protein [Burkholderia ubonensis]|uniref:hypothetical protein n=1 Tax=Burkholderia ubonensis TaxID=101571 RepID=UPI000AD2498C|nr:hypothetical protein [Burkholderia ubonensis]
MTAIRSVCEDALFLLNPVIDALEKLKRDINCRMNGMTILVGAYGTEDSIFFAYFSMLRHKNGDEIAITVSVDVSDNLINIDSDVCENSGRIILDGPKLTEKFSDWPSSRAACDVWLERFCGFLFENIDAIVDEAKKLPDEGG